MKIKKYTGISLESIFSKVKSDLGEKAVILSTKRLRDDGALGISKIEVTAALAPSLFEESVLPKPAADEEGCRKFLQEIRSKMQEAPAAACAVEDQKMPSGNASLQVLERDVSEMKELLKSFCLQGASAADGKFRDIKAKLAPSGIEEDILLTLIGRIKKSLPQDSSEIKDSSLLDAMSELVQTAPFSLDCAPGDVISVLGTTGVGKTTTLAKLASLSSLSHSRPVALVTLDSFRVGAHEHLERYARILEAPFTAVSPSENLKDSVEKLRKDHVVFIDSSGISQYNKIKIKELCSRLKEISPAKNLLLLSASTHPVEMKRTVENFCQALPVSGLVITKLDEVERPGHLLSLGRFSSLPVHFVTDGQVVPDHIHPSSALSLAKKVLYGKLS